LAFVFELRGTGLNVALDVGGRVNARFEALAQHGVIVHAEVVQRAFFGVGEEPCAAVEGVLIRLRGDDLADEEGLVADAVRVIDAALDPADPAFEERRVDLAGTERRQARELELVELSAARATEVLDVMEELAGGDVEGEL